MESNEVLDRLPRHLMSLVIDQPYNEYTAQDHAVWRYVMRQNVHFLSRVAHGSYVDGLRRTGISIDSIPHMYGMNRILKQIGWAAVAVDGFIPPSAFMEFQAYNVLVIAADIRPVDQIEYTPAPDIIHEAAGHAPIIADPEYAAYLKRFGEIGAKAFSSKNDYRLYEAIRHLSIIKADPYTTPADIATAEAELEAIANNMGEPSEMALIRNLHWWTVEYGLIGTLEAPKIYGAGLLSSIGESYNCLKPAVRKLPYTKEAANYNFDITTQQPHLFVTSDFAHLTQVLEEFADGMAWRTGGISGIRKAVDSGSVATLVYSSGLQVSGIFSELTANGELPVYVRASSPTALAYRDVQLPGHGKDYHAHGFGSPVGMFRGVDTPPEELTDEQLKELNIVPGGQVRIEFEHGVVVEGKLTGIEKRDGLNLLFIFENCRVTYRDQLLFDPAWGTYDMAVGRRIRSAFQGPADADAYGLSYEVPAEQTHKIEHTPEARALHELYEKVRTLRDGKADMPALLAVLEEVKRNYPDEWLLPLEIFELCLQEQPESDETVALFEYLWTMRERKPELTKLIFDGLAIAGNVI